MPKFYFQAMDATGREFNDHIHAENETEAQAVIRQAGYFVTMIRESTSDMEPSGDRIPKHILGTNQEPSVYSFAAIGFAILIFVFFVGLIVGMNFQN